jgi:hypothetical protein
VRAFSTFTSFSDWCMPCETPRVMTFPAGGSLERKTWLCHFFLNLRTFQEAHSVIRMTCRSFITSVHYRNIWKYENEKIKENSNKVEYLLPSSIDILCTYFHVETFKITHTSYAYCLTLVLYHNIAVYFSSHYIWRFPITLHHFLKHNFNNRIGCCCNLF